MDRINVGPQKIFHTIDRWFSKTGIASRSETVRMIREGRISWNGRIVTSPDLSVPAPIGEFPEITLDGHILSPTPYLVLAMNKPRGVLVGLDPRRREKEIDRLIEKSPWGSKTGFSGKISPLGRLDMASSGLILLTTRPGELSDLLDPAFEVPRTYRVQVRPVMSPEDLARIRKGDAGSPWGFMAPQIEIARANERTTWIDITLCEGKNREIRKILSGLGYTILHLIRTRFGDLCLGDEGMQEVGGIWDVTAHFGGVGGFRVDIILDRIKRGAIINMKVAGGQTPKVAGI
jgi:23S rRNA pseudouridine2605 synthase